MKIIKVEHATRFYPTLATVAVAVVFLCLRAGEVCAADERAAIPVVVSHDATPGERLAAQELARYLGQIYPREQFVIADRLPDAGPGILVGNVTTDVAVRKYVRRNSLKAAESYAVTTVTDGRRSLGVIAGADARGTAYGVYGLLRKLDCGFNLSGDTLPAPRTNAFSFAGWKLADQPLVRDRLVFNWHNFLSGCSTWNLPDWNRWIDQSQKLGFNAIMVHAYGNNPMAGFTFDGRTKTVGYLTTTRLGRDWSTMHVNDVRRLWGGEVFDQPAFGADAALGPEEQRADAAQKLMREVFTHAGERGMDVYFAYDVDTASANPQELIQSLPETARFAIQSKAAGKFWLANPDTPEGNRYYRAQVASLLKAYPQITCLVMWFRINPTPWLELKISEMPAAWQKEYAAELARTPAAGKLWHAPQMFALGKIVRAFDRALKELGQDRVQLAAGTWEFMFLAPCDRFFPPHVKLIGLDYEVLREQSQFRDAASRQVIREVAKHRPVIPVAWAQHDDGHYTGRPFTPFAEFNSKLTDTRASGFGIIHWTTRPLDLYFASLSDQVWQSRRDQPLRTTCDDRAEREFGPDARAVMGEYLFHWINDAPCFGRETGDFFVDRPLTNVAAVVAGCRERLKLIGRVDATALTAGQRARLDYYCGLEEFIAAFFQANGLFQRSQGALAAGRFAEARALIAECRPEPVIEQFAKFSSSGGITRGEQGLVVTLNLRWLTHILRHRQMLGLEPARFSFGPTSHERLAQSAGKFTFDVSAGREFWERRGAKETGAIPWTLPADIKLTRDPASPSAWEEICRQGIEMDKPKRLVFTPIMTVDSRTQVKSAKFAAGEYRLRLLFADPVSTAPGQRVFKVQIGTNAPSDRVDIFQATGRSHRVLERNYPVTVGRAGQVAVTLTPVEGKTLICGAVLEPMTLESD